jgi:dTDP-glucose pyrophosphorylase
MNVLIPMAGEGSRFSQAGYTFPKPLIDVEGKPMIQHVVENVDVIGNIDNYIFLVRQEHLDAYNINSLLEKITNGRQTIIPVKEKTEGAACTALLAKEAIMSSPGHEYEELLIVNSDQIIEYSPHNFRLIIREDGIRPNGVVFCFNATHPKWSFAEVDKYDNIVRVAEKDPISDIATTGHYYFSEAENFFWAAETMIKKNIRTKGEFYIAPCYNELIQTRHDVVPFFINKMWGLGTPEDLELYLSRR